jgi:uncharacterized protein YyaL (SSP411 family)
MFGVQYSIETMEGDAMSERTTNRLIHEKSPYLLQHAHNPVDWYPWGEEAFARAKAENKPVFLSIGYSTCHWCHVMEKESFEDPEVARLMNEAFVNIKVDREERPDVDHVYMAACQLATGGGGWPLTVLLTPERQPFFIGTYFPRQGRPGMPGLLDLVPRLRELWATQMGDVVHTAAQITSVLADHETAAAGRLPDPRDLERGVAELRRRYDPDHGGFGGAPKFPTPHQLLFLLRQWRRSAEAGLLDMVTHTLRRMRLGGIFDQVGFGFHRYSTDAAWRVPHFEKMLYDQALLVLAYTEAHQATGDPFFGQVVREVIEYVQRDLAHPEGAFHAAEDADSEGREGAFYLWNLAEMERLFPAGDVEWLRVLLSVRLEGNFDSGAGEIAGANILYLHEDWPDAAARLEMPEDVLRAKWAAARKVLFEARRQRIRPHRDDKVLADWNGLMIAALAKAGAALGEPAWVEAAGRAADFILTRLADGPGRLRHSWLEGTGAGPGLAADYAAMAWGLVELYLAGGEPLRLRQALELTDSLLARFWDPEQGGFFFTPDDGEPLLVRPKELYDGAVPSGNSMAVGNLFRLARLVGRADLEERAWQAARLFGEALGQSPSAFSHFLSALDFGLAPSSEVVVTGPPAAPGTAALRDVVRRSFLPGTVLLYAPNGEQGAELAGLVPSIRDLPRRNGPAAYVCQGFACQAPVSDPGELRRALGLK